MNEEITLNVTENSPYAIGAIAYVEQLEDGAKITIVDKNGTTTAVVNDGNGIQSVTLNEDYTLTIFYTDGTSVTTTSIRGEKGESGVYVGTTEPTDPDVNVWVDPSGESDEILIEKYVDEWLDEHPEATTTVEDESLTEEKFTDELKLKTIKDYVTPEMFGAKGDGVTDDTDAFATASLTSNAILLSPNSTYLIDNATITDCSIIGNAATIKTASTFALTIQATNRNVVIDNLKIDCNGKGGISFSGNGIEVNNCYAYNLGTYGFYIGTTANYETNFISCKAYSNATDGSACVGTGFYIGSSDCTITSCVAINCSVGIRSCGSNNITNCHIWVGAHNVLRAGSIGFMLRGDEICVGNYADSVQYAFYLDPDSWASWSSQICESRWLLDDSTNEGVTFYFLYSSASKSAKNVRINSVYCQDRGLPRYYYPDFMCPRISGMMGSYVKNTFEHNIQSGFTENSYSVTYFDGGMAYKGSITLSSNKNNTDWIMSLPVTPFNVSNGFGKAVKSDGTVANVNVNLSSIAVGAGGMTSGDYDLYFTMYY